MGINDDLVLKMTGYEISDIMVYKAPHEDYEELTEKIGAMEGVRKVSLYEDGVPERGGRAVKLLRVGRLW